RPGLGAGIVASGVILAVGLEHINAAALLVGQIVADRLFFMHFYFSFALRLLRRSNRARSQQERRSNPTEMFLFHRAFPLRANPESPQLAAIGKRVNSEPQRQG